MNPRLPRWAAGRSHREGLPLARGDKSVFQLFVIYSNSDAVDIDAAIQLNKVSPAVELVVKREK